MIKSNGHIYLLAFPVRTTYYLLQLLRVWRIPIKSSLNWSVFFYANCYFPLRLFKEELMAIQTFTVIGQNTNKALEILRQTSILVIFNGISYCFQICMTTHMYACHTKTLLIGTSEYFYLTIPSFSTFPRFLLFLCYYLSTKCRLLVLAALHVCNFFVGKSKHPNNCLE